LIVLGSFVVALFNLGLVDPPWAGPTLPAGAHWISYSTNATYRQPVCPGPQDLLLASTDVDSLRAQLQSLLPACTTISSSPPVFPDATTSPRHLYLVADLPGACGQATTTRFALAGATLTQVTWYGVSHGCNIAAIRGGPTYSLVSIPYSDLPVPSTLTIQLLSQGHCCADSPPSNQIAVSLA
jgi:hypothetical protein